MERRLEILGQDPVEAVSTPLHELTQSAIHTFASCPQKFALRYLLRIRRSGVSESLSIGSAVHNGFEVLFDRKHRDTDPRTRESLAVEAVHETFDHMLDKLLIVPAVQDRMDKWRAQAVSMLEAWCILYGGDTEDWTSVESEMKIRARPDQADKAEGFGHRMAGMVDGIVMIDGRLCALEHKTTQSLTYYTGNHLPIDGQLLWYMLLCRLAINQLERPVEQVFYNVIKKPQHRTPRNYEGLKAKMLASIMDDPDKYFFNQVITFEPHLIDRAMRSFAEIIRLMDTTTKEGRFWCNYKSCNEFGGCEFIPICAAGGDVNKPETILGLDELAGYQIVNNVHTELDEV